MKRPADIGIGMGLLVLLVCAAWAYPYLVPGYVGFDGDGLFLFYPALKFAREEILAGRLPLWNPYKFLGSPLLADLMVPAFYPPQLLMLLLPQPLGQHLGIVAHASWAGVGAYVAARRAFGASAWGGILAGLTFALCAPMQAHASHPNQFFAMAWLPWTLTAALNWARAERVGEAGLLLGIVLGMQCLAGQPQIVGYSGVIVLAALANALVREPRRGLIRLAALGLASAVALGISAVQVIPAFELSRYSLREGGTLEFAQSFSLPAANLKTLLLPGALGGPGLGGYRGEWNFTETAIFCGQGALLLAVIGLAAARRRDVWLLVGSMSLIGLIWALGASTPVYALVLKVLPPLGQFRAPARAFVLVALSLAMLAALGLDEARRWLDGGGVPPMAARSVAALLIAAQFGALLYFRFGVLAPPLTRLDEAMVPGWERLLSGVAGGDGRVFRLMTEIDYGDARLEATRAKVRVLQPDVNVLHGVPEIYGYEEGMLPKADYVVFLRQNLRRLYSPEPDTALLGLMGVKYVLADKPVRGAALRLVHFEEGVALLENKDFRGMAFTRDQWPGLDWTALEGSEGESVRFKRDDVAKSDAWREAPPLRSLKSTRLSPTRIRIEWPDRGDGRLILSETWMPGWEARTEDGLRVPGRRLAPFLVEFDFPEGVRVAELRYRPGSFRWGLAVSGATLAAVLIGALVSYLPRSPDQARRSPS